MTKTSFLIISMIFIASCLQSKVDEVQVNNLCGYSFSSPQEKIFLDTNSMILKEAVPSFPVSENLTKKINKGGVIACVLLEFNLLPSGELIDINVLNDNQERSFIRSSIRALRKYTFKKVSIQTSGIVSIRYVLE